MAMPLPVDVTGDVTIKPAAAVEAALYFAIAEALANVVKHSDASRAWIALRSSRDALSAAVGDNGIGGAVVGAGHGGLYGIQRRLAAFGLIEVAGPPGGPTVVTMELSCAS
jgi:signal transduction histidine kinase